MTAITERSLGLHRTKSKCLADILLNAICYWLRLSPFLGLRISAILTLPNTTALSSKASFNTP